MWNCLFVCMDGKFIHREYFSRQFYSTIFHFSVCIQIQHCLFGFTLEYDAELCWINNVIFIAGRKNCFRLEKLTFKICLWFNFFPFLFFCLFQHRICLENIWEENWGKIQCRRNFYGFYSDNWRGFLRKTSEIWVWKIGGFLIKCMRKWMYLHDGWKKV